MKKSKLLVLSLLAVSAMSLSGCGQAGEKGDKGDKGDQGLKGDTGAPGKDGTNGTNGKDGEDGSSFLNGEGVPASTLGKDGDTYLDTKSYDLYVKESGAWVKKGNIKGAQGEKGDTGATGAKGDTGASGSSGAKGDKGDKGDPGDKGDKGDAGATAWSSSFLPMSGGSVIPSVGSAVEGGDVTFKIVPEKGKYVESVTLNGNEYTLTGKDYKIEFNEKDNYYYIPATMPEGGFVVSAEFGTPSNKQNILDLKTGTLYENLKGALDASATSGYYKLVQAATVFDNNTNTDLGKTIFNNNVVIDLGGYTLSSSVTLNLGTGVDTFKLIGEGTFASTASDVAIAVHTKNKSNITIDKDVTLTASGSTAGILVSIKSWTKNTDGTVLETAKGVQAELNVLGTVENTGSGSGVKVEGGQTSREVLANNSLFGSELSAFGEGTEETVQESNIVVNVSGKVSSTNGKGLEILAGTLNVTDGEVSGKPAVYADNKSGDKPVINLTGGKFKFAGEGTSDDAIQIEAGVEVTVSKEVEEQASGNKEYTLYESDEGKVIVNTMNPDKTVTYTVKPEKDYNLVELCVGDVTYTAGFKRDSKNDSYSITLDKKDGWNKVSAKFRAIPKKADGESAYVSIGTNGYESLQEALDTIGTSCTAKTTIKLEKDLTIDTQIQMFIQGEVEIDLNHHNIKLTDLVNPIAGAKSNRISVVNTKLSITGEGKISSNDTIFNLMGGYKSNSEGVQWNGEKLLETTLTIGKDVVTESKTEAAIGVYKTLNDSITTDEAWKKALDNRLTINYYGTDLSNQGIVYVNGEIGKTGWKNNGADKQLEKDDTAHPKINIENASSTGRAYIAGYCDLTVKNSTFKTRGTAFNIMSGNINFESNTFENTNKNVKTPYYVGDAEGAVDGNATIWLQNGIEGYAGIDSAIFKSNTFNDEAKAGYYNVGYFANGDDLVAPKFVDGSNNEYDYKDTTNYYIVKKASDMKAKMEFTYGGGKELVAYFLNAEDAEGYTKEKLVKEYNLDEKSDFKDLTLKK